MEPKVVKKRRALRGYRSTEEALTNPISPSPFHEAIFSRTQSKPTEDTESNLRAQSLLNLIHYAHLMETFKQSVNKFKGTNCPLLYKKDYNFTEKW
jgi:hypothetical protein